MAHGEQDGLGGFACGIDLKDRKVNMERRACSQTALHADGTTMIFHNPMDHGKPRPRTIANLFCGEIRVKIRPMIVGAMPGPVSRTVNLT